MVGCTQTNISYNIYIFLYHYDQRKRAYRTRAGRFPGNENNEEDYTTQLFNELKKNRTGETRGRLKNISITFRL